MKSFLAAAGAIGIVFSVFLAVIRLQNAAPDDLTAQKESLLEIEPQNILPVAAVNASLSALPSASAPPPAAETAAAQPPENAKKAAVSGEAKKEAVQSPPEDKKLQPAAENDKAAQNPATIKRIENPYPFPPQSFEIINAETRLALVNINCAARGGSLRSTSGSGVIVDPRGVILTNAHVAQYILLSSDRRVDLSCVIRAGSPARDKWVADVLYIPPVWVKEHAGEIRSARAMSTGEHDYALLRLVGTFDGSPMPASFPYLPVDAREAIGFLDDPVLAASYPAEFIGGITSQFNLFPASSVTSIKDMLTFNFNTVDVISLGGVIEAQSGSSGGAVTNAWGRLIGVISTTSEGTTTAQRDLRAVTISYINRDMFEQNGFDLLTFLGGNVETQAAEFNVNIAPGLLQLLISNIEGRRN